METLFKIRVEKLVNEVKKYFDADVIILRSFDALSYLFADMYNPPPNELSIMYMIINTKTLEAITYISLLDYFRALEYYGNVSMVRFVPVFSSSMKLPNDVSVISFEEMRRFIENALNNARVIASDNMSSCESRLCVNIRPIIDLVRRVKTDAEISLIREAINITERALKEISALIIPGTSEKEITGKLIELVLNYGADGIAYSPIVAIGKNTAKPHHLPQTTRFEGAEPILIDFGVRFRGYVSDVTRIFVKSNLSPEYSEIHKYIELISGVIDAVVSELKPGVKASFIDSIARNLLKKEGLDQFFIHGLGHGIGVDVHEPPRLSSNSTDTLMHGDVITVEPGIYMYNKFGVRIEENAYINESGGKVLTSLPRVIYL
ncbi:MAG: M24 family metallopeptidase [Ignisphaera sp.]